jgi:ATP-dependent RNA helicase SUPV3L1/SUV3
LAEEGGIAGRAYLADAMAVLPKEARGAARKGGIVFGALDVYHHTALKPAATKWRTALFAARDSKPMPALPPESAVHLKDWKFASIAECRNAGYRKIGDEYLRIDLAERIVKKAHEARGMAMSFGMDMAFVTSLGVSDIGLNALMRDAGFKQTEAVVPEVMEPILDETDIRHSQEDGHDAIMESDVAENKDSVVTIEVPALTQPVILTHWRWVGIRKPKPQANQRTAKAVRPAKPDDDKKRPPRTAAPRQNAPRASVRPPAPPPPSSLALQLAALQSLQLPKSK